jgi:hypothetical protein
MHPSSTCIHMAIAEGDLERIWVSLMLHLCRRHRMKARNGEPTDWRIEDLRNEHYGGFTDSEHFRTHIVELANRHWEIKTAGDIVRLTPRGLTTCVNYVPEWQRDF